jgi:hypothetical protein
MGSNSRGGAAAPTRPPRYDDVVAGASDAAASTVAGGAPTTNEPAGAVRGAQAASSSFADDTEDDPGDRDLVQRRPRARDLIAQRLGLDESPSYGDRFEWCRDAIGSRYLFSRRYSKASVLVDLFEGDNAATRDEVARKRAAIAAHNARAKAQLEQLMEAAKDQAAYESGVEFLRQRGELAFGYLPMIGIPADLDVAALKAGAVLDLPARTGSDPFVPAGVGVSHR